MAACAANARAEARFNEHNRPIAWRQRSLTQDAVRVFPSRFKPFFEELFEASKAWRVQAAHNFDVFLRERLGISFCG